MVDYLIGMGDRFADTAAAFAREAEVTPSKDGACGSMRMQLVLLLLLY